MKRKVKAKNPAKFDNYIGIGTSKYHFSGLYEKIEVLMKPSIFLKLAHPLKNLDNSEFIINHIRNNFPIATPFLFIGMNLKGDIKITGHEGRHRMHSIKFIFGDNPTNVLLIFDKFESIKKIPDFLAYINRGILSEDNFFVDGPLFEIL